MLEKKITILIKYKIAVKKIISIIILIVLIL